jgi:hypothetical protein
MSKANGYARQDSAACTVTRSLETPGPTWTLALRQPDTMLSPRRILRSAWIVCDVAQISVHRARIGTATKGCFPHTVNGIAVSLRAAAAPRYRCRQSLATE